MSLLVVPILKSDVVFHSSHPTKFDKIVIAEHTGYECLFVHKDTGKKVFFAHIAGRFVETNLSLNGC